MPFGEIGAKTAFFGKYAATGGRRPPETRTFQTWAQQAVARRGTYGGVARGFSRAAERARKANLARKQQIESMYGEMMKRYQPGGAFERAGLGQIERARTKGVGQETQHMISSGLFGTTTAAQTGRRWEAEVGAPSRLRLEDIMQQRLTGIQQQKAGFLERIKEPYPDYSALMR